MKLLKELTEAELDAVAGGAGSAYGLALATALGSKANAVGFVQLAITPSSALSEAYASATGSGAVAKALATAAL
jgi:hypothetical protein